MKKKIIALLIAAGCLSTAAYAQTTAEIQNDSGVIRVKGKTTADTTVTLTVQSADDDSGLYAVKETVSNGGGDYTFNFTLRNRSAQADVYRYFLTIKGDTILTQNINVFSEAIVNDFVTGVREGKLYTLLQNNDQKEIALSIGMDTVSYDKLDENIREKVCAAFYEDGEKDWTKAEIGKIFNSEMILYQSKAASDGQYEAVISAFIAEGFDWNTLTDFTKKRLRETRNYNNIKELLAETEKFEALDRVNHAKYTQLAELFETNKKMLTLDGSSEYSQYKGMSESTKRSVNENIVSELIKTPAQTIEEFVRIFKRCIPITPPPTGGNSGSSPKKSAYPGGEGTTTDNSSFLITDNSNAQIPEKQRIFHDIEEDFWAAEGIEALAEQQIISGYGDGTFRPGNSITREEFVTILAKAFGLTSETGECPFEDIARSQWYYPYVAGAYGKGIVNGLAPTRFGLGTEITRQDVAVMIARALGRQEGQEKQLFADDDAIADYAKSAVYTLREAKVISGREDNQFVPDGKCTRAECAVMIKKAMELNE